MRAFLVIENYKEGKTKEIYERFSACGRMLPDGVIFIDSWVEENMQKCYQIMKSEDFEKLNVWIDNWKDLVDFEIIRVLSSEEVVNKLED